MKENKKQKTCIANIKKKKKKGFNLNHYSL